MISEERRRRLFARRIQARPWALAWPSVMTAKTIPKTAENNRQSISGQRRLQCPDGGQWKGNGNVLPSDSRGHLHISITFMRPYALYAPLLGVGVFSAFSLLRELHTVHTAAYDRKPNRALALLPVGIEASPARENRKCIRRCIRLSGRKAPISPLPHRRAPSDAWDGTWQTSPS